ncbi:MAG: DinB family protein [Pirellulales bacterium]
MDFKDAVRSQLATADFLVGKYLDDLTDAEILERPVPTANHIAWQLGHLIAAERHLVEAAAPGSMPELPAGFAERHSRAKPVSDEPGNYLKKAEYQQLAKDIRAATLQALDRLTAADFDRPLEGRLPPWVKRVGDAFMTVGGHWVLHAGQWVVLRRKLKREVMF